MTLTETSRHGGEIRATSPVRHYAVHRELAGMGSPDSEVRKKALSGLFKQALTKRDPGEPSIAAEVEALGRLECAPNLPFEIACLKINFLCLEARFSHNIALEDSHALAMRTIEALDDFWLEHLRPGMAHWSAWQQWTPEKLAQFTADLHGAISNPAKSMPFFLQINENLRFVVQGFGTPNAGNLMGFRTHLMMTCVWLALGEDRPEVMRSPQIEEIGRILRTMLERELEAYLNANEYRPAVSPDQDEAMAIIARLHREAEQERSGG